ncbi:MAG TPA: hypothetical protein VFX59_30695 [Polyangiales bacterium]|nr:hypothetical protein [Polyangiales bacterium]
MALGKWYAAVPSTDAATPVEQASAFGLAAGVAPAPGEVALSPGASMAAPVCLRARRRLTEGVIERQRRRHELGPAT